MYTIEEKRFFRNTALGAREINNNTQGAIVVRGKQIQSYGYSRRVVPKREYEISAIHDAVFGARDVNLEGAVLFSTYFPSLDDVILILSVGISTVYFMGEINDAKAVDLINCSKENDISLAMIKLE